MPNMSTMQAAYEEALREAQASDAVVRDLGLYALKYDEGKNQLELLPPDGVEAIGRVLTYGAQKYAPRNWEKGMSTGRLAGATLRHVFARMRGERNDPETGMPHLAHAGCCILFWLCHDLPGIGADDFKGLVND